MKFSIIIPSYNSQTSIERCINSISAQTFKDFEIIVIDDGSTDRSLQLLERLKTLENRLLVICQKNHGVSFARNTGLRIARGDYVIFVDSDDFIEKTYLENFACKINKFDFDLIVCGFNMVEEHTLDTLKSITFENSEAKKKNEIGKLICRLDENSLLSGPFAKCFKRSIIESESILFDSRFNFGEDALFNLTFIQKISSIANVNQQGYYYMQSQSDSLVKRIYSYTITHSFIERLTALRNELIEKFEYDSAIYRDYINTQYFLFEFKAIKSCYSARYLENSRQRYFYLRNLMTALRENKINLNSSYQIIFYQHFKLLNPILLDILFRLYFKLGFLK